MDKLVETLDTKLHQWPPDVAEQVRQHIEEIIELADQDGLDILRSRAVEQEVLDELDELPDITQTRTWQMRGSLEIPQPEDKYIVAQDREGHVITNYAEKVDEILY